MHKALANRLVNLAQEKVWIGELASQHDLSCWLGCKTSNQTNKQLTEPCDEISNNVICATSKGSDQAVHMCSLIRAFADRLNILWTFIKFNYCMTTKKNDYFQYFLSKHTFCVLTKKFHLAGGIYNFWKRRTVCEKITNHMTEAVWKIEDWKQIEHTK